MNDNIKIECENCEDGVVSTVYDMGMRVLGECPKCKGTKYFYMTREELTAELADLVDEKMELEHQINLIKELLS